MVQMRLWYSQHFVFCPSRTFLKTIGSSEGRMLSSMSSASASIFAMSAMLEPEMSASRREAVEDDAPRGIGDTPAGGIAEVVVGSIAMSDGAESPESESGESNVDEQDLLVLRECAWMSVRAPVFAFSSDSKLAFVTNLVNDKCRSALLSSSS